MLLGDRLNEQRNASDLTEAEVGDALRVPPELVSAWETGASMPSTRLLDELAHLYRVSARSLLGLDETADHRDRSVFFRNAGDSPSTRLEVGRWLDFLDRWAELLEDLGESLPGLGAPPPELDRGEVVTDLSQAPTLAMEVRDYYNLGAISTPDLCAFLDAHDVLVYRLPQGSPAAMNSGVSGAFYNHPKLGYSVLVNAGTSRGRQAFTLAHEYCHALFHYDKGGLISSINRRDDPLEAFANQFAGHFLVPATELQSMSDVEPTAFDVMHLAAYFRVSYRLMLVRLWQEELISWETYESHSEWSPRWLAERFGLNPCEFEVPTAAVGETERYPASVLRRARRAVEHGDLTPSQAAGLLEVDVVSLQFDLLAEPAPATADESEAEKEFDALFYEPSF